jgi:hypothetical protein
MPRSNKRILCRAWLACRQCLAIQQDQTSILLRQRIHAC